MIGNHKGIVMMMINEAVRLRCIHHSIFFKMFKIELIRSYGIGLMSYCQSKNSLIFCILNLVSFFLQINLCLKLMLNFINIFLECILVIRQILMIFYMNYHTIMIFILSFINFLLYFDLLYYSYFHANDYIFYYSVVNSVPFY